MLLKKDLVNSMDSLYGGMLKEVSIPDFTKCVAQFAGMRVQDVKDEVIRDYLITWAENKYKFYKLLGNKLKLDMPITYKSIKDNICGEIEELAKEYPGFAPWLDQFSTLKINKIEDYGDVGYYAKNWIRDLFPNYNIEGNTLTGFFKRKLNAPDELVTAIGRIFENDTINGTYTISIDPIDMMLASENPYNWQSCYRLEVPNDASHADGCLAAILDDSSLITYIWDKEGKFNLYDHELKSVRYKRIREWIAVSPSMNAIHFNQIYPGKSGYPEEFRRQLRDLVETVVANYKEVKNLWKKSEHIYCIREIDYGYSEFCSDQIWELKDSDPESWEVYGTAIKCPCGCGSLLPASEDGDIIYNGDGFICENFCEDEYRPYCSLGEDYCPYAEDMCDGNCRGCWAYDNEYPLCNLDNETECENVDRELVDDGRMQSCSGHCEGCPLWAQHHPSEAEEEMVTETITATPGTISFGASVFDIKSSGWTFNAIDDLSTYTISQDDFNYSTLPFPELPTVVTGTRSTSFSESVTMDQIREAVEQAPPLDILNITSEMIEHARDEAIANGTIQNEIVFGIENKGGLAYREINYEDLIDNKRK